MKTLYNDKNSNWTIKIDNNGSIWYVAKSKECKSGIFGSKKYLSLYLYNEIEKDKDNIDKISKSAIEIMRNNLSNYRKNKLNEILQG